MSDSSTSDLSWERMLSERDKEIDILNEQLDYVKEELIKIARLSPAGWMSSKAQDILYHLRDMDKKIK